MTQQFWINDYYIDCSRNQIQHNNITTNMPQKALAVLVMLIESKGQVVSHETIMGSVWKNRVVAPNTLQRSIAQLRKAFGDDSKQQSIIKTHAKQGYSLEATVRKLEKPTNILQHVTTEEHSEGNRKFILATLIIIVFGIAFWFSYKPVLSYAQAKPLTTSDHREAKARYSPDGRFIVFQRNIDKCFSHLWAKDLQTQIEYQLTKKAGIYGTHSWSEDGNQLAFVERNNCQKKENKTQLCWQLLTLDFINALKGAQHTTPRLDCNSLQAGLARWLPNGKIGILRQHKKEVHKLQAYNPRTEKLTDIYIPEHKYIYSYDYSFTSNTFAAISTTLDNQHIVEKISLEGEVLSSAIIQRPDGISFYDYYFIRFHPDGDYLVTSTKLGIFQLFFDGSLKKIETLIRHSLYSPSFHPDGRRLVVTQANADSDITLLDLKQMDINKQHPFDLQGNSISRSNVSDTNGQFQPNGNNIAFISKRSGKRQLWLFNGENSSQISKLKYGLQSVDFAWSHNGKQLVSIAQNKLVLFDLKGNMSRINTTLNIYKILQWTKKNQLLVMANQDNKEQLFKVDMKTLEIDKLVSNDVIWANITANNKLIYVDSAKQFWIKNDKTEEILELFGQLESNILALENNVLFGINKQKELWQYSLTTRKFKILQQLPLEARYVSDMSDGRLLITQMVDYQKELLELY